MTQKTRENSIRDNKTSAVVERQLPAFVRERYPDFVTFIKKYYEFTEQNGQVVNVLHSLLDYNDIDLSEVEFLDRFHKEIAPLIPRGLVVDKRLLFKNIREFYRSRGTEDSFRAFFKFVFGEKIDFYYPHDDIFKTSDNTWVIKKSIRVYSVSGNIFELIDKKITGSVSGAEAVVDNVLKYQIGSLPVYELFLNPKSISGSFLPEELISELDNSVTFRAYTCITGVEITEHGEDYEEGEELSLSGGNGFGAKLIIGAVNQAGNVKRVDLINPGAGYKVPGTVTFPTKSSTATGSLTTGILITYPGYYLNKNSFTSTTKYLQDSYFYQQFSYVVKSNYSIDVYKEMVKNVLHPAGLIMFGSVFAESLKDASSSIPVLSSSGYDTLVDISSVDDVSVSLSESATKILVEGEIAAEDEPKIGPNYGDVYKYSMLEALPENTTLDITDFYGATLWLKSTEGVIVNEDNKVLSWKNIANGDPDITGPINSDYKPIATRADNKGNILTNSRDLTNIDWPKNNVTASQVSTTNFDGTLSVSRITASSGSSSHYITNNSSNHSSGLAIAGQKIVLTTWVKGNGHDYVWVGDSGNSYDHGATINLSNGNIVNETHLDDSSTEDLGNGWYKVVLKYTRQNSGDIEFVINICDSSGSSSSYSWNASGTEQIYIGGTSVVFDEWDHYEVVTFDSPAFAGVLGKELLKFDGIDDQLEGPVLSDLITESDYTVFMVFKIYSCITNNVTISSNSPVVSDSGNKFGTFLTSDGVIHALNNDGSIDETTVQSDQDGVQVVMVKHTSGVIAVQANETYASSSVSSGDTSSLSGTLLLGGNTAFSNIGLGEVLVFNRALDNQESDKIMKYLKESWKGIKYMSDKHQMSAPNDDYWYGHTNIVNHFNDFSNNVWNKNSLVVGMQQDDYTPYYNGINNKIIENSSNSDHNISQQVGLVKNNVINMSIYAKSSNRNLLLKLERSSTEISAIFNLQDGTVVSSLGTITALDKIELINNGWYKCSIKSLIQSSGVYDFTVGMIDLSGNDSYNGDGASYILISNPEVYNFDEYVSGPSITQIKDLGELTMNDLEDHPLKRTQLSIPSQVKCREVIWDINGITMDINPSYRVLRSVNSLDWSVEWLKDQRNNVLRFESGDNKPLYSESSFNNLSCISFDQSSNTFLTSQSLLFDIIQDDLFGGKIVFKANDVISKGILFCDSDSTPNLSIYVESGEIHFLTMGSSEQIVSLPVSADIYYIVSFSLIGGVMSLSLIGGAEGDDTLSGCDDVASLSSNLLIGGDTDFFDGDIARIIIYDQDLSSDDLNLLDNILTSKYGIV